MAANDPSPRWLEDEAKQKLLHDQQQEEEENEEIRELEEAAAAGTGVSGRRSKSPYSSSAASSKNKKKPYKKSTKPSLKLEEDEDEEEEDEEEAEKRRKRRKITKPFFAVLSTFTILLGLALIASNFYSIVNKEEEKQDGKGKEGEEGEAVLLLRHVYHAFAILLTIPAILTELSIKWWKKLCPLLSYLFFRGLFYCLIACLSVDDFTPASENIAGFIFLGFGMFYMSLGVLCVKRHVET